MKKLGFILLLLLSCADPVFAQPRRGALQVRLRDDKMLTVVLDGRHFRKYGTSITVADVPLGMHELKVYYFYPANDPKFRTARDNRSHAVLIYKGRVHVDGGMMYYCTVDPVYKTMKIRESRTLSLDNGEPSYPVNTELVFSDEKEEDNSYRNKDNWDDRRQDNKTNVFSYYRDEKLMTPTQMVTLKEAVADRTGSADKVAVIEQYTSNKSLMTDQVMTMLGWLSFESSKLELAKSCYPNVLDKENYLQVSSLLTFQSSKRDLEAYTYAYNKKNNRHPNDVWLDDVEDEYDPYTKPGEQDYSAKNTAVKESGPLLQSQLSTLGKGVSEKLTDSDKQKLMQQYLENRTMTSEQVSSMLDWFTFEGTKLEFAKWSFSRVTDKGGFGLIKSKFAFSSSKKTIDDLVLKN